VPGGTTSLTATGLDNNTQYTFTVKALNKVNYSPPRTSEPFQPLGTPAPPGTPAVADLESGSDRTSVRITWPSTLPEGPGETLYTVSYSTGGGAVEVPGCVTVQALTCVHSGVDYDGRTYAYTVRAHNIANTSGPSQPATFQAVGRPAAWGGWTVVPTGANQQLRVDATAPDPRGKDGSAAIIVGGQVVWEGRVVAGQAISQNVPTQTNDAPSSVQLRMCNEFATQRGCSLSDVRTVQSYGPLSEASLDQPTASVSGKTVTWTISGHSNGDPAVVSISIDGGPPEIVRLPGAASFSFNRAQVTEKYDQRTTIDVTIYDDAPGGRGEDRESAAATSAPPPPPEVYLAKGGSCSTAEGASPSCTESSAGNLGDCTNDSCAFLDLRWVNEGGDFNCGIEYRELVVWKRLVSTQIPSGASSNARIAYFGTPGATLRVSCNRTVTSNEITW
jgi:large repetitive protein